MFKVKRLVAYRTWHRQYSQHSTAHLITSHLYVLFRQISAGQYTASPDIEWQIYPLVKTDYTETRHPLRVIAIHSREYEYLPAADVTKTLTAHF